MLVRAVHEHHGACDRDAVTHSQPPTVAPLHPYVANDNAGAQILQFNLPLTRSTTSNFTMTATNNVVSLGLDANGDLAAGLLNGSINFFTAPLTGASTPTATFSNGGASNNGQLAWANGSGRVDVYNLPITAASTPVFALSTGVNTPEGLALDPAGNLYIGNLSDATVTVYSAPITAGSAPSLIFKVSTGAFAIFGIAVGK